jgi:hypothetical protein
MLASFRFTASRFDRQELPKGSPSARPGPPFITGDPRKIGEGRNERSAVITVFDTSPKRGVPEIQFARRTVARLAGQRVTGCHRVVLLLSSISVVAPVLPFTASFRGRERIRIAEPFGQDDGVGAHARQQQITFGDYECLLVQQRILVTSRHFLY